METKNVCDADDVYSLSDALHDPNISEAMIGRAFVILGIKREELGEDQKAECPFVFSPIFQL